MNLKIPHIESYYITKNIDSGLSKSLKYYSCLKYLCHDFHDFKFLCNSLSLGEEVAHMHAPATYSRYLNEK